MKYKLIAPVQQNYSPIEQVLHNRGIEDINKYLKSSIKDINSPHELNSIQLRNGLAMLAYHIARNDKTAIIIDPDVDGNTASALLLNYLYNLYPTFVKNIQWIFHEGKQHGLNDCVDELLKDDYKLILCPDAGSNDTEACKKLKDNQCDVLILDHHDFDRENPYPVIINNQDHYSDYNNKFLSGVGVVWQFCRFIDETLNKDFANKYLDLVAIGNCGDMMSMRSVETKTLINEGLQHIQNPFIYHMAQKNAFKLGSKITSIGAAFYIVPLLNAIQRSGTQEEKKLAFASMLEFKAFEQVPSTKRGHKLGDTETIVEQAIRTCTNVKNRQTRVQDAAIDQLEKQIIDNNLLENCKVLILLLKQDSNVPAEVRGLIANKFMAKYQRPCCILTEAEEYSGQTMTGLRYETSYSGSARGCALAGIDDFKQLCLDSGCVEYAIGHPNAFGLKIYKRDLQKFIDYMNEQLKDMSDEAIYYVDYIFKGHDINGNVILSIADMSEFWGTDVDEALVAIENLKVTPDMVDIYQKTTNTIKISTRNGISLMKFNADEELCNKLKSNNTGYVELDIIGKCNKNEWNGNVTPQIFIEDFNIIDSNKYYF